MALVGCVYSLGPIVHSWDFLNILSSSTLAYECILCCQHMMSHPTHMPCYDSVHVACQQPFAFGVRGQRKTLKTDFRLLPPPRNQPTTPFPFLARLLLLHVYLFQKFLKRSLPGLFPLCTFLILIDKDRGTDAMTSTLLSHYYTAIEERYDDRSLGGRAIIACTNSLG